MKIQYIANIRMPTEKAHGVQIMKTCEALARAGSTVELVVPNRKTSILQDPFEYYGVEKLFAVRHIPVLDLIWLGRIGFWLESISFAISAALYSIGRGDELYYSRDEFPLWLLSFFVPRTMWESHTGRYNFFTHRHLRVGRKSVVISKGLKDFYNSKQVGAELLVAADAIDLQAFQNPETQEVAQKRLGLPADKKIALYIGRLDGWKGVSTLLEASRLLPHEEIVVAIIGGEEKEIHTYREKYPNVTFLGPRPYKELADNQAAADMLVLPNTGKDIVSVQFTSPMKLFSYMAAGKPIIASDLPSIREVLNEQNAVFFTPDDPQSLADAIRTAHANPESVAQLAERAKVDALGYSWDVRAHSILEFIS